MPTWSLKPGFGGNATPAEDAVATNLVAVIGRSQITKVVVAKIVERCGLRPSAESPENAERLLMTLKPGTVILDGGADNGDCNHLLAGIATLRRLSERNLPHVILLSTRNGTPESLALSPIVDAVVAKPITPEALQPVVGRLVEAARA